MSRDLTRDVVRGLTALEMTFVNISGLPATAHSPYIGQITYADTIFPCFAFLSGMSPIPSRKSAGVIGIGLGLHSVYSVVNKTNLRVPGVLQRLGLAGIIANNPHLAPLRQFYGLPLFVLWYAIILLGSPSPNPLAHPDFPEADAKNTAQTKIDVTLFGERLYRPTFDPEGILGALNTAVSMIVGEAFARQTFSKTEQILGSMGMIATGEALHYLLPKYAPISKSLWTPSFTLVTSGVSILKYLAIESALPYLPLAMQSLIGCLGKRSLEIYVLSSICTMILKYGDEKSLWSRGKAFIGAFVGGDVADFVMSSSLAGAMAASAFFMVQNGLRLKW